MNRNSLPVFFKFDHALATANNLASKTGRRWRVRQSGPIGRLWYIHEVDQPVIIRKTTKEI